MYISVLTLFVEDVDRAVDFYTKKLGWDKTMDVPMGEDRWVTVAPPGERTSFTLTKGPPSWAPDKAVGGFSGVIIEVDDVHQAHAKLEQQNVEFTDEPRIEPWGGWAMFMDSEGNIHGLHSPVSAAVSNN